MPVDFPPHRPPALARRLGKFALFLARGHPPALAWWLASRDAVRRQSYRGVTRAALEAAWRADPTWVDLVVRGPHIHSAALGLEFTGEDPASRGYATWRSLHRLGWEFSREGERLLARRDGLTLGIETAEEEEMLAEIYLRRCYDLRLPGRWQVVDIGANVGMAALFFAQQPGVEHVHAFEPFAPTADTLQRQLERNPHLAARISLTRLALGEKAGQLTVDYHAELRGSMSLAGLGAWRGAPVGPAQRISVQVQPASAALASVFSAQGNCRLLAKLDCEGSEYGILRELDASGSLARFSAFVIEWHGQGPDALVEILARRGFVVHVAPLSDDPRVLGLIYAVLPAAR